jgi:cytochrome P450
MDYAAVARPATYADDEKLHALLTHMRHNKPIALIETDRHRPFWAIAKHADVIEIERQNELFINAPRAVLASIEMERAAESRGALIRTLINMDEPDHRVFREMTKDWFMPANLKSVEPRVATLAKQVVDRMLELGDEFDFVKDVAVWYPLRVIMMILGVPEQDEALMLKLTQELFGADDPDMKRKSTSDQERMATIMEFFAYFTQLTKDRRANPGDDVATVIANATINGELIGEIEAMSYYLIIATAGHDTTSSSTAGGLLGLMQHPDEMTKLRGNLDLLPTMVEEAIRWVTPVKHFMRTATQDYTLRDQVIKAGESVMLMYASANRDEDVFDAPFEFRADRRPNKHVAFGHGAHHCLGNLLAKMEMRALYREIFSRVKSIELNGEPKWVQSTFVSGLKTLPVRVKAN